MPAKTAAKSKALNKTEHGRISVQFDRMDDLMAQSSKDKRIADLFTKGSHHRNLSIIYIVQNIFHQGKEIRNISLNGIMPINISCCSSHQEINNKFLCLPDK